MKLYSIQERPEYIPEILTSLENDWPAAVTWTRRHLEACGKESGKGVPAAYVGVVNGKMIGFYTLMERPLFDRNKKELWLALLFVEPKFRGRKLSPMLIADAQKKGRALGYEKIYLETEHDDYYEKFGFHYLGDDVCVWFAPTKVYEGSTQVIRKAAG